MSLRGLRLFLPSLLAISLLPGMAYASPRPSPHPKPHTIFHPSSGGSIQGVERKVDQLRTDAADAAEAANGAQVRLTALLGTLSGVKGKQALEGAALGNMKKNLGRIAASAYKTGGIGAGVQLLFAPNPSQYLASAGVLEAVTRSQGVQLRLYGAAEQRLHQTSMVVGDQVKLVKAAQREFVSSAALANSKLAAAERLLRSLKGDQRRRFFASQAAKNSANRKSSLHSAKLGKTISGRGGIALRFALQQIGDSYFWGGAGPTRWDCSGLTMIAYRQAGLSLPHSSQAQMGYGRRVSRGSLQPGDLVFFYRSITHVGIYLGNGLMVDAPRPGRNVEVVPVNSMPFAGAVRL